MIGTTAAILGAAALGVGGSLITGAMGANAANQAATTQAAASDRVLQLSDAQYQQQRKDAEPWLAAGREALDQYLGELGVSDAAKDGTFESQFKETPEYANQVKEGEKGVVNNLAALGMKGSGAALKALTRFRQGLADTTYNNYLSKLYATATGGQAVQQQVDTAGQNNIIRAGQSITDSAAARASGYVGGSNAWGNALSGAANTTGSALGWLSGNRGWSSTPSFGGLY